MSDRKQPTLSHRRERFLGMMILACSVGSVCHQGDAQQFTDQSLQAQQSVSTNQLLTPRRAQRTTDRACDDIRHGHLESAQKELRRALDEAPHYAVALAAQGAVNLEIGDIDGAANAFQHAVDEDPTLGAAYVGAGIALIAQDRFKEALTPLDRAARLLPDSWYLHLETGLAHLGIGNTEAALKEAELAERLAGTDPERRSGASYLRAMVSTVMKDSDRARKYLAETITRDPGGFYATLAQKRGERPQMAVTERK